jgi:hypothetical protein
LQEEQKKGESDKKINKRKVNAKKKWENVHRTNLVLFGRIGGELKTFSNNRKFV